MTHYKGFKPSVQIIGNLDLTRYILLNTLSKALCFAEPCLKFSNFSLAFSDYIKCLLISECE